jgi:hypothetical protein
LFNVAEFANPAELAKNSKKKRCVGCSFVDQKHFFISRFKPHNFSDADSIPNFFGFEYRFGFDC